MALHDGKNPKKPPTVTPPSDRPISIDREERPLVGNATSKL